MRYGLYLYCIALGERELHRNEKKNLGNIGIDRNEVYMIPYKDLWAVVHNSSTKPYISDDEEVVRAWIFFHEKVVEKVWERFDTILPVGFSTIIKPDEHKDAKSNMERWLKADYENLKEKLNKVKGKAEYGIQISWNPKMMSERLIQKSDEIKRLNKIIQNSKSRGMSYMYKQKLADLLRKEMEKEADRYFKEFYQRIKESADSLKIEKTKNVEEGKQMLMNLSCLIDKNRVKTMGEELGKIKHIEGFFVRFTGPWPPYSFA